jgi:hypothetical protein
MRTQVLFRAKLGKRILLKAGRKPSGDSSPLPSEARGNVLLKQAEDAVWLCPLDTKILVAFPLFFDVFGHYVIRDIAAATAEVPSGPQVPPPKLLPQMGVFLQHLVRCLSFQSLHQSAYRDLRRQRDQKVNMILTDVPFDDVHVLLPADLPDQLPHPQADLTRQNGLSIFRDPHQMEMDRVNAMRSVSIFAHPSMLTPKTR